MNVNDLQETIRKRRAVRDYTSDEVSQDSVERILEAARWAPSASNSQPWDFVIVRDELLRKRIVEIYIEGTKKSIAYEERVRKDVEKKFPFTVPKWLEKVPIFIVACCDPRFKEAYPLTDLMNGEENLIASMSAAIQNIHLAASTLGLATTWGTPCQEVREQIGELLEIPPPLQISAIIPVGYPASQSTKPRRELKSMVHYERFDKNKLRREEEVEEFIKARSRRAPYKGYI